MDDPLLTKLAAHLLREDYVADELDALYTAKAILDEVDQTAADYEGSSSRRRVSEDGRSRSRLVHRRRERVEG